MELHLTPEQEAQLAQVARQAGKPVEQCLTDAAVAMLHERNVFLAAIDEGIAAADQGELVGDDEVLRWLEKRDIDHGTQQC